MKIVWRSIALEDLDEARRYIMQDDPDAAERVRTAIRSTIEQLAETPHLGKPGRVAGTREPAISDNPLHRGLCRHREPSRRPRGAACGRS